MDLEYNELVERRCELEERISTFFDDAEVIDYDDYVYSDLCYELQQINEKIEEFFI